MQYIKAATAISMASLNGHREGSLLRDGYNPTLRNVATALIEDGLGGLAGAAAGSVAGPAGALAGFCAGLAVTGYH